MSVLTDLPAGQVIVNEDNAHNTKEFLTKRLTAIKNQRTSGELEDLALIIGRILFLNMHPGHRAEFLYVCRWEELVVCT